MSMSITEGYNHYAANKALADMTKSRDTWWDNYQQIKAEYDAYRAAHPDTADGGAE